MNQPLVVAPVVIPLFTGALLILTPRRLVWQQWVSAVSLVIGLLVNLALMRYVWTKGCSLFTQEISPLRLGSPLWPI